MATVTVTIFISYGYDVHSIIVPKETYDRIQTGQAVKIKGQGFMTDDARTQDFWSFNHEGGGKVYVYGDDTRDVYNGDDY